MHLKPKTGTQLASERHAVVDTFLPEIDHGQIRAMSVANRNNVIMLASPQYPVAVAFHFMLHIQCNNGFVFN